MNSLLYIFILVLLSWKTSLMWSCYWWRWHDRSRRWSYITVSYYLT